MSKRTEALAVRLEQGAKALAEFAATLTEAQWQTRVSATDARRVGVIVHHVAWQYDIEVQLTRQISEGKALEGVSWADVHAINAKHASDYDKATKQEALDLLKKNSAMAAAFVRSLKDDQLDLGMPNSLYGGAPLTTQFFIEDHVLRHSWWHLDKVRSVLAQPGKAAA